VDAARKRCGKCKTEKPRADFGKNRSASDGLAHWCRVCHNAYQKNRYATDPGHRERVKKAARRWDAENGGQHFRHGLTKEELAELQKRHGNVCCICQKPCNTQEVLSVDHDHSCCTHRNKSCGKCVRGLLCFKCNTGLGRFNDDPDLLQRAITYLRVKPAQQILRDIREGK